MYLDLSMLPYLKDTYNHVLCSGLIGQTDHLHKTKRFRSFTYHDCTISKTQYYTLYLYIHRVLRYTFVVQTRKQFCVIPGICINYCLGLSTLRSLMKLSPCVMDLFAVVV